MSFENPSRQWTTRLLAHDLFNSLAVAILDIDLLLEGESDLSNAVSSTLQRTFQSLLSMQKLVSEVLKYERQQCQGINQCSNINVNELVAGTLEVCANQSGANKRRLVYDLNGCDLYIMGHEVLLRQAILNILANAITHSAPGSSIHVKVIEHAELCTIQIQDDGSGMDATTRDSIFEPFAQRQDGELNGHGLGMSLVKWIATQHNGDVVIDSEPGKGTTVKLQLSRGSPYPITDFPRQEAVPSSLLVDG